MSERIFPNWSEIKKLKPQPQPGEYELLKHLDKNLPPTFEIFFQPSLNGDKPDIAILEENFGLMIIEVKDWDLRSYKTEKSSFKKQSFGSTRTINFKRFFVKKNNAEIAGPLSQVNRYIDNLTLLYEPELKERISYKIRSRLFSKAIYFHNALTQEAINFLFLEDEESRKEGQKKCLIVGNDQLENFSDKIDRIISNRKKENIDFSDINDDDFDWVSKVRFWLNPPFHELESGEPITLTSRQKDILDTNNRHIRVKGVAGSGKTLVLAQKAANLAQSGKKVLVVSFNITLWHYIRDCISRARYGFSWASIEFTHLHGFCKNYLRENGEKWGYYDEDDEVFTEIIPQRVIDLHKAGKNRKNRQYDAILIDEGQDYVPRWYEMLCRFLTSNDELVFVSDPMQNIYNRENDWVDSMKDTKFRGRWRILNETVRLPEKIMYETNRFSNLFINKNNDALEPVFVDNSNNQLNFLDPHLVWRNELNVNKKKNNIENPLIGKILTAYKWLTEKQGEHPQDIIFLLPDHEEGLQLVKAFNAKNKKLQINHIFEKKYNGKRSNLKKLGFWMKSPKLKMCTIHSFKGWELKNIVLITPKDIDIPKGIDLEEWEEKIHKIIYTSITRTRGNLIVFNRMEKYKNYGKDWPDKW